MPIMRLSRMRAGGAAVVTLSGELFISDFDPSVNPPWDSRSGIRVNTDGTIDKYLFNGVGYSQIDASTDWIIPNSAASSSYQVRLDVNSNAPTGSLSDSTATWLALTQNRVWIRQGTTGGSVAWNWTLRIRLGTGSEIDNAVYAGDTNGGL